MNILSFPCTIKIFKKKVFLAFRFMSSCLCDCFHTCAITIPPWIAFSGLFSSRMEKFCAIYKSEANIAGNTHNGELELVSC